jgi:phosphoglycerate dehydrogenase-like enzyme
VWSAPEEALAAIRRAFGARWQVVVVEAPASSDGDGAAASDEAVSAARGAEVFMGWGVPPAVARAALGSLRWAHTAAAGVAATLSPEFRATGATLTNSRGIHAEPMADWAVAAIAACARGFHHAIAAQRERRWAKDAFTDGGVPVRELREVRVGLVGLGGIGRAVARRCHALGMAVRAVRRRRRAGRVRHVQWVGGPADLARLARQSDVLVLAAPLTPATRSLVGEPVLAALPAGAFVINLSRGDLLDESALLAHLDSGHVGGAVLDVFALEPLPADHAFWTHPRVLITPHVSGVSQRFWERETALIVENVRRYRNGRRLRNTVNPEAGY